MKITTKGKYGLKAMIDIAVFGNNSYISINSISKRQGIPQRYLERIIILLKNKKLVKSIRGSQGGYTLSKNADKIKAGEILRALEGSLSPVSCIQCYENDAGCNDDCSVCVSKILWKKLYKSINTTVDSVTLKELADEYKLKHGKK